jgi:hypothetical protein
MLESLLSGVFSEVSRARLEAEPAVCFVLDDKFRLIYCNPAWDRFARENGAPHLCGEMALGTSVLNAISGEVLDYYRRLYRAVLADGQPRGHELQCSSPDKERLVHMQTYRLKNAPALLVSCAVRIEQLHPAPAQDPVEHLYRNPQGLIVMCGNCRRTRRPGLQPEVWDWVSAFVRRLPAAVSHGLCNLCLEYYYPDLSG